MSYKDVIVSVSAGSGKDEAILKFGDCLPVRQTGFALPHKSWQVLAKTFTILRKVS